MTSGVNQAQSCAYAIFLCGNPGVGKSTLSNALGAKFAAGFAFGGGLTTGVSHCKVRINEDLVMIIDAPGMYEVSKGATHQNAKGIQKALGVELPYKIAFVVASNGGRWLPQDAGIIDKIVNSIKASDDTPIEYILIINQIQEDHWMYYMDEDTLEKMVKVLIEATATKTTFKTVLPCPHIPNPSENEMLKAKLLDAFNMKSYRIEIVNDIDADQDDLQFYQKALLALFSPVYGPFLGFYAAYSSFKNKILYDDWRPFEKQ